MRLDLGQATVISYSGYVWSRVVESSTGAYYLSLYPADVNSLNRNSHWLGIPLRCLYNGNV